MTARYSQAFFHLWKRAIIRPIPKRNPPLIYLLSLFFFFFLILIFIVNNFYAMPVYVSRFRTEYNCCNYIGPMCP